MKIAVIFILIENMIKVNLAVTWNTKEKSENILIQNVKSDIISKEYALCAKKCALLNF